MLKSSKRKGNSAPDSCNLRKARPALAGDPGLVLNKPGDMVTAIDEIRDHHARSGLDEDNLGTYAGHGRLAGGLFLVAAIDIFLRPLTGNAQDNRSCAPRSMRKTRLVRPPSRAICAPATSRRHKEIQARQHAFASSWSLAAIMFSRLLHALDHKGSGGPRRAG